MLKFIYSEKATTLVRWRYRKTFWPSQIIWTLLLCTFTVSLLCTYCFYKRESLKNLSSNHILASQIVMVSLCIMQRKPKTDPHIIKSTNKRTEVSWDTFPIWIFNHGPFWAVGAAERKKPNCHKYATFEASLSLCFHGHKIIFILLKKMPYCLHSKVT